MRDYRGAAHAFAGPLSPTGADSVVRNIISKEVDSAMIAAGFRAEDDCIKAGSTRADRMSQIYAAMKASRRRVTPS